MQLNDEQYEKMGSVFEVVLEYTEMAKENNSAKTEALTNLLDEFCPKPQGKMNAAAKEIYKNQRSEAKQFISDTLREYKRDKDQAPETTADALLASEKLLNK